MPNPLYIAGAIVGAIVLSGRKRGPAGPSDGAIPASSIEQTADGDTVKATEVELGVKVGPLPGDPIKRAPQVQTAPAPKTQVAPSTGVVNAAEVAVGTSLVEASMGLARAAQLASGGKTYVQSPPIFVGSSTPRTVADAAAKAGALVGAIW